MSLEIIDNYLFKNYARFVHEKTGIELKDHKKYLVINRLSKFVGNNRRFSSYEDLFHYMEKGFDKKLIEDVINAITTNFSFFFRDKIHFDFLDLYLKRKIRDAGEMRIWSAACSTGEEPYSIAMVAKKYLSLNPMIDFKILATDISTEVLYKAHKGIYLKDKIEDKVEQRYSSYLKDYDEKSYKIREDIKSLISFRYLNLLKPFPFKKMFDIIFLRNVLIYFSQTEKQLLINRIEDYIKPGGFLILGLSESIISLQSGLKSYKHSIYKKIE